MLPSSYEGSLSRPGDDLIIEGWLAGVSTAEIGRRAGRTKNAIVGRAHRMMAMGLIDPRPSPIQRDGYTPTRVPQPPRVTGPTLPPLASIAAADASEPPLAVPRTPDARPRTVTGGQDAGGATAHLRIAPPSPRPGAAPWVPLGSVASGSADREAGDRRAAVHSRGRSLHLDGQ